MKSWTVRALVLAALLVCVAGSLLAQGEVSHPAANPAVAPKESALAGQPAEARTEAERKAKDTEGVKSVTNQLKVAPAAAKSPAKTPSKKSSP